MQQISSYTVLVDRLDAFIRKYYRNQLVKGAIYSVTVFLAFYIAVVLFEFFGRFDTGVRTFLFYLFVFFNAVIVGKFIFEPLLKLYRLGKTISREEAARIIGKYFPEVEDKLLNVLQLREAAGIPGSAELAEASISQKIRGMSPVPFVSAIRISENKKYLKYAAVPVLTFFLLLFFGQDVIPGSTRRLIAHRTYFEKPLPFHFELLNNTLKAVRQEDFELKVKLTGKEIPAEVYVEADGHRYKLDRESRILFRYTFKNLQENKMFRFFADGYYSRTYELVALPNPVMLGFDATLEYPSYLHRKAENVRNTGDFLVPAGTKIRWNFATRNARMLQLIFKDTTVKLDAGSEGGITFSKHFLQNDFYTLSVSNEYLKSRDSIQYAVSVIPDMYPAIEVSQAADSFSTKRYFFSGEVRDDYGFNRLTFNYRILKQESEPGNVITENLPVNRASTRDNLFYMWDMSGIALDPGDRIEYYFEVWDNDGVMGSKHTRSETRMYNAPDLRELAEQNEQKSDAIKTKLKDNIAEARRLQKEIEQMNKTLLEKKNLSWDDKKKLEDLLRRQQQLENNMTEVKHENQKRMNEQQENREVNREMLAKQEELNRLMDRFMTDEMKKMMEEMKDLLDKLDKKKLQESLEQMKYNAKDAEKALDRTLEIFKQLEFGEKLKEAAQALEKLAKDQEKLAKDALEKNADNKALQKQQEAKTDEMKALSKDLQELEQKNNALEFPQDYKAPDQETGDILNDMQQSQQQLGEGKNKKASQSQKSASDKMQQLADKLQQMQSGMEMEQMEENMDALRAILENLIKLSFDQESLMQLLKNTDTDDPSFNRIAQQQRKIKADAKMVEDSLFELSKRVVQIQSAVNQEINTIHLNTDKTLLLLQDMKSIHPSGDAASLKSEAAGRQQYVMTSVNNLALMLSEALNAMQQAMSNMNSSSPKNCQKPGQCKKPGSNASPSAAHLKKLQEQLNQQLQQLKEGMKPGKKEGKGGEGGLSEQLARMAAQQEAIRHELEKLSQENNKDGTGTLGDLEEIARKMEQSETDIVNKMLTQETLLRQQEILTRLLEAEKAERERDQDDKRESNEAKNAENGNGLQFEAYKKARLKEMELLNTIPPSFTPFFKLKVNEYFQTLEKQ